MSSVYVTNCPECGRNFEYGLFSRNYPYCEECAERLDLYCFRSRATSKLPKDWPDVTTRPAFEDPYLRQVRYTREDHRRAMDG
jgi:hypothetical protein